MSAEKEKDHNVPYLIQVSRFCLQSNSSLLVYCSWLVKGNIDSESKSEVESYFRWMVMLNEADAEALKMTDYRRLPLLPIRNLA